MFSIYILALLICALRTHRFAPAWVSRASLYLWMCERVFQLHQRRRPFEACMHTVAACNLPAPWKACMGHLVFFTEPEVPFRIIQTFLHPLIYFILKVMLFNKYSMHCLTWLCSCLFLASSPQS